MKRTFLLLSLLIFVFGCSAKKTTITDTAEGNLKSFQEGMTEITNTLHSNIITEIKSGKLRSVLDIYVANTNEQTTARRLDFSTFLENALILKMRSIQSGKDASITYIESREKDKTVTQGEAIKNAKKAGGNALLTGSYLQSDNNKIQIHLKVIDMHTGFVSASASTVINGKTIPPEIFKTFPAEVTKNMKSLQNLLLNSNLFEFSSVVTSNWNKEFNQSQKDVLRNQITHLIRKNISTLTKGVNTLEQLQQLRKNIDDLQNTTFKIDLLGFDYHFNQGEMATIQKGKATIEEYEKMLKFGLNTSLSFIAKNSDNDPLDFECNAWFDHDLVVFLGSEKFHYDDGDCQLIKGQQFMIWKRPMKLSPTVYQVKAIEEGLWDSNLAGFIKISPDHLIQLYNQGIIDLQIDATVYYLRFIKEVSLKK